MYKPNTIGTQAHDQALAAMKTKQPAAAKPVFKPEPAVNLEEIKFAPIKVGRHSLTLYLSVSLHHQIELKLSFVALFSRNTKSNGPWSAVTSKTWSVCLFVPFFFY
jgi:hypothetical protein